MLAKLFFLIPSDKKDSPDTWVSQLFIIKAVSTEVLMGISLMCCPWYCWRLAEISNWFPHVYGFCPRCASWCSGKWKLSLKTGPDFSKGWSFWGDESALTVLICDTPSTEMLFSEGAPLSSTPCQQPEIKEVIVKHTLTFLRRHHKCNLIHQRISPWNYFQEKEVGVTLRKQLLCTTQSLRSKNSAGLNRRRTQRKAQGERQVLQIILCQWPYFFWPWHLACGMQGLNQCPLQRKHRVLTTGPPGRACQ